MRHLLRRLTANGKLKLASLALALLLWAVVSAEQVTVRWLPVRVEADVRDPRWALEGGPRPAVVNVRFAGPVRELWEMALSPPTVVLTVREADAAGTVVIHPGMVRIPAGFSAVAQDVRPSTVRLPLQRLVTRDVPVRVRLGGGSRLRWTLGDSVRVEPATVRLRGPASRLDGVDSVSTAPLHLFAGDTLFDRGIALDTTGIGALVPSAPLVRVRGRAEPRAERVVTVPVTLPPGAGASPATVQVRVDGADRRVRALDPASLRVVPARTGRVPPEGAEVAVRVEGAPAGVQATPLTATVRLVPLAGVPAPAAPPVPDSVAPGAAVQTVPGPGGTR